MATPCTDLRQIEISASIRIGPVSDDGCFNLLLLLTERRFSGFAPACRAS